MEEYIREKVKKIKDIFLQQGFEEVQLDGDLLLKYRGTYHKITYIYKWNSVIIESADNYENAKNNIFEDSDLYCLSDEDFIEKILSDLREYYID